MTFSDFATAQAGAQRRGQRLLTFLTVYLVITTLCILSYLGGALWLVTRTAVGIAYGSGFLVWGVAALSLVSFVVGLCAQLTARRAVASVKAYVGAAAHSAGSVGDNTRGFTQWLSVWQWVTLISAVFGVAFNTSMLNLMQALDPSQANDVSSNMPAVVLIVSNLPTVVLTWLTLNAVKKFFSTVGQRAAGQQVLVTPAASAAANWMLFSTIVLGIMSGLYVLLGAVVTLVLPAMANSTGVGNIAQVAGFLAVPMLLISALFWYITAALAWSRGFALDVARVLDDPSNAPTSPTALHPAGAYPAVAPPQL